MACYTCLLVMLIAVRAVNCEEYLIALAKTDTTAFISATTGLEEGWLTYKLANSSEPNHLQMISYSRQRITIDQHSLAGIGVENKSLILNASGEISVSGNYRYAAFAPLPVSSLGTKYILPYCGVVERESVLVVASHHTGTNVSVTLRLGSGTIVYDGMTYGDGDVITQHLHPYQTFSFTFKSDVTRTVIATTSPVAVFLGSYYSGQVDTYDQLVPVSAYGDEYAVALKDEPDNHELQITGEHTATEIHFNDGTMLNGSLHSTTFKSNETFYFRSTNPVMATLCRRARSVYSSVFVVIPPISSYRKKKVAFFVPYSRVITSVKVITKRSADVKIERYTEDPSSSYWSDIPGSQYKVGTCEIPNKYAVSFSSNDSFTILAFSRYFVQNGGYGLPFDETIIAAVTVAKTTTKISMPSSSPETNRTPFAAKMTEDDPANSNVLIVAIIGGLVIIALVVVIATVSSRMRRRRDGDLSLPGTPQLMTSMMDRE